MGVFEGMSEGIKMVYDRLSRNMFADDADLCRMSNLTSSSCSRAYNRDGG